MEATAGVAAAARGGSLTMPSFRKEWRAVSEHHPVRNAADEELERSKPGQSDERMMYEGREPADVDFCSITVEGSPDNDILQQRLHSVARQREELQHMEIELRARMIARSEIVEMQNSFDAQLKERANAAAKLQEQLQEKEKTICELERKMEEKERELHAIKLDNEAAWAKEDLLRERDKELATFRRERDHSEAERAQHIKQIHEFQEHIQEKERKLMDLQEKLIYKDAQLKEAEVWIERCQQMDALSHSLQAELRERTEQYNQLWHGCQRKFAELESLHLHTIHQLHLELADARERSGAFSDGSCVSQANSKEASQPAQNNGNQIDASTGGTSSGYTGVLANGNSDSVSSFTSTGIVSNQTGHVPGVALAPTSLLGVTPYMQPAQMTALHPYVMHQQGVPRSVPPNVPQSHVGHYHSMPAGSSLQQWQTQQAVSEDSRISKHNQIHQSQADDNQIRTDVKYNYEMSVNGQTVHPDYLDAHIQQRVENDSVNSSSAGESQAFEPIHGSFLVPSEPGQGLQQMSSQFHDALRLGSLEQNSETREQNVLPLENHGLEGPNSEQPSFVTSPSPSDNSSYSVNPTEIEVNNGAGSVLCEAFSSTAQTNMSPPGKTSETILLDDRSLLACIVRTIPPGGKIRISSTLPNRLGKMLAPLHWHDYKKKYGKLDDFVASHPELFLIEGDYIQHREGAQEMIAATTAVAKVAAAAAAASSPHSSFLASVAVTPMAQTHRLKKVPSADASPVKAEKSLAKEYGGPTSNATENLSQHSNGVCFGVTGNVKILSKPKDSEMNGFETKPGKSSIPLTTRNGVNVNRSGVSSAQKGSMNARSSSKFKHQGRDVGATSSRR